MCMAFRRCPSPCVHLSLMYLNTPQFARLGCTIVWEVKPKCNSFGHPGQMRRYRSHRGRESGTHGVIQSLLMECRVPWNKRLLTRTASLFPSVAERRGNVRLLFWKRIVPGVPVLPVLLYRAGLKGNQRFASRRMEVVFFGKFKVRSFFVKYCMHAPTALSSSINTWAGTPLDTPFRICSVSLNFSLNLHPPSQRSTSPLVCSIQDLNHLYTTLRRSTHIFKKIPPQLTCNEGRP